MVGRNIFFPGLASIIYLTEAPFEIRSSLPANYQIYSAVKGVDITGSAEKNLAPSRLIFLEGAVGLYKMFS